MPVINNWPTNSKPTPWILQCLILGKFNRTIGNNFSFNNWPSGQQVPDDFRVVLETRIFFCFRNVFFNAIHLGDSSRLRLWGSVREKAWRWGQNWCFDFLRLLRQNYRRNQKKKGIKKWRGRCEIKNEENRNGIQWSGIELSARRFGAE